jgi:hypothetical protein
MNQPAERAEMRASMPRLAQWVDERRAEWGRAHVADCIRRSMAGEPGLFYGIEAGRVLGTPFPLDSAMADPQRLAIVAGLKFAAFMAMPAGQAGTYAAQAGEESARGAH